MRCTTATLPLFNLGSFYNSSTLSGIPLPEHHVAAAFSFIFSGVSLALVAAAPLGSYLGDKLGWRTVFIAVGIISVLIILLQWLTEPSAQLTLATYTQQE
ncbi:MFS transporter [Vibrio sp. CDRSL-10 TSBA]